MGLGTIKSELSSIIRELESIKSGLASGFEGIGSERAANKIGDFIDECERAHRALGRVNPSNLAEAFLDKKEKS